MLKKHLLNVASAKDMDENGNDLENTVMGILQNVEEHELYLYQHDEKLKLLKEENEQLKERILMIEKLLEAQSKAIKILVEK